MPAVTVRQHLHMGKNSSFALYPKDSFPPDPQIGQPELVNGVFYIYAEYNGITDWFPLTNKKLSYIHYQNEESTIWSVQHDLNTEDFLYIVRDENDVAMLVNVKSTSSNTAEVQCSYPAKGRAVFIADSQSFGYVPNDWEIISEGSTYLSSPGDMLIVEGDVTVRLPFNPQSGAQIYLAVGGNWETNPSTLDRNGNRIMGEEDDLQLDINRGLSLVYKDSTYGWVVAP